MKILTILGARPQFIKAAAVSRAISDQSGFEEMIIHTGQHYDYNMSSVFFEQLDIPKPDYNLEISNLSHGAMTARMLEGLEAAIINQKPDCVLVYGDTNSTLAGALAASKLHVPVAHVEAGLRSKNMKMPEEVNRVLTDRVSSILFCPTQTATFNLYSEGYPFLDAQEKRQVVLDVGDVMYDATLYYKDRAMQEVSLEYWSLTENNYILFMHRDRPWVYHHDSFQHHHVRDPLHCYEHRVSKLIKARQLPGLLTWTAFSMTLILFESNYSAV